MTVILAARTRAHGVVMAADSETSAGWEKIQADRHKLWTAAGQYLIGAAGCVRTAQVIKHFTTWPRYRADEHTDVEEFLVKQLVPAIRRAVDGQGVLDTTKPVHTLATSLLIAWGDDHIAEINANGAVIQPRAGRYAIGSGYAEALGALGDQGPWTRTAVIEAARRATITAHGCGGPIVVGDTKRLTIETTPTSAQGDATLTAPPSRATRGSGGEPRSS